MPEEKDADKDVHSTKKPGKDIFEGIESHRESEMGEEREDGPTAPMRDLRGPIVLSESTYVGEDKEFEEQKRRPVEEQKKKYPPDKVP